jgi:hypothetical protein
METTTKIHNGSPDPSLEAKDGETAKKNGSQENINTGDDDWASPITAYIEQKRVIRNQEMRTCPSCKLEKPGSDFYSGTYVCKTCYIRANTERRHRTGVCSPYTESKGSSQYLGVYVAESVLADVFKSATRCPFGNKGYDFVCGRNYKIDVKSACLSHKDSWPGWGFAINGNKIADYFLCIAFGDRESLDPQFLLLIPGPEVNHLSALVVRKSNFQKWAKYQLPLEDVKERCSIFVRKRAEA